jgi:hypothetical protein
VVWSYFNNCGDERGAAFATRPVEQPVFHDIGATIPT